MTVYKENINTLSIYVQSFHWPQSQLQKGWGKFSYKRMMCKSVFFYLNILHMENYEKKQFSYLHQPFHFSFLDSCALVVTRHSCASVWFKRSRCVLGTWRPKRQHLPFFKTSLRYYCTSSRHCRCGICFDWQHTAANWTILVMTWGAFSSKWSPHGQLNTVNFSKHA